MLLLMLCRW
uniref:Uncharacterized protein n=1 Tax=Arundo donax TaxID=35708 RepID=A0A0A8XTW4_ARUDO